MNIYFACCIAFEPLTRQHRALKTSPFATGRHGSPGHPDRRTRATTAAWASGRLTGSHHNLIRHWAEM
ncbi:hypothetical protein [Bosea sp. BE125]|uniref:hypothetical protein n=1 Tax=Bosea sp. BE125 TaxID=2817909 RepID=UPI0038574A7C